MKRERVVLTEAQYDGAFACINGSCPQKSGKDGCPLWTELEIETMVSGDRDVGVRRTVSGCAPVVLVNSQLENTLSCMLSLNSVQDLRDEIVALKTERRNELNAIGDDLGWLRKAVFYIGKKIDRKELTDGK